MKRVRLWIKALFLKIRVKLNLQRYALNPLRNYPRNIPCWCGSHKKAKVCCLPKQAMLCTPEQAVVLNRYVREVTK